MRIAGSSFPGLNAALDSASVLERLREAVPDCSQGLSLLDNVILDVRYRPGGECWILYRVKVRRGKHRSERILLSARMLRRYETPDPVPFPLLEKFRGLRGTVLRTPEIRLDDMHMVLYPFPVDASMPGLLDAVDPARMKKHLSRLWARQGVRVVRVEADTRGYTPHARAAFFYDVLCENRETREPSVRRLVGKIHAKKGAARLFGDAWALWQEGGGRVSLAPPVGYVGEAGITLQERVPGQRLGGLVDQPGFNRRVKVTARMLAKLHSLAIPLATRRRPREEAENVARWAGVLTAISPGMTARIERLRDALASEIEARARLSSPIHADFHHTNVLFDGDRITIIDLDEMAFGDPMVDVGRFMASLRVPSRRAFGSIAALSDAEEAFLTEYLSRSGEDGKRARLFEAAALLIAAGSSFRVQRKNWEEEVELLVAESERKAKEARGIAAGTGDLRPPPPPEEARMRWACDGVYMQAVLDPHVRNVYGVQLTRCRVVRSREGRIEYAVRGFRGGDRWQGSLEGRTGWNSGVRFMKRLDQLRGRLEPISRAPLLPRPVAHVKPLSLLVWEVPVGTRFSTLLGTPRARKAAGSVAEALATLHGIPAPFEGRRSLAQELEHIRPRIDRFRETRKDLAPRVVAAWAEIGARYRGLPDRFVPVLRTVHPHHVLAAGGRVGLDNIEDLTLAHPYLDAADFLARLAILGIGMDIPDEAAEVAARFREAYHLGRTGTDEGLAAFEACALLRMAGRRAQARNGSADRLLEAAERRLVS
jgi:aminoglycoside phosphotransferase (APT) family kinase protein